VVEPIGALQVVAADPAGDRVLEAARAFGPNVIVSGDRHLLDLETWSEIEILPPAELIARSEVERGGDACGVTSRVGLVGSNGSWGRDRV